MFVFDIPDRGEVGDMAYFALLALVGVKCVNELFRPSEKLSAAKSRYGRLRFKIGSAAD